MTNPSIAKSTDQSNLIDRLRTNVPVELLSTPQWVMWRSVRRGDKLAKLPFQTSGQPADSTDPKTWTSFDAAAGAYANGGFAGLGFVFTPDDPYCGVDLDGLTEDDDRWRIITNLDSYAELSQSGQGAHAIIRGVKPGDRCRNDSAGVEIYDSGRDFVMTGDVLPESPATIGNRQTALTSLYNAIFAPAPQQTTPRPNVDSAPIPTDDSELWARMFASKNGAEIESLYRGDKSAYGDNWSSADFAIVAHLAWWTGSDSARMARMWGQTGLADRPKFERADYVQRTINNAMAGTNGAYQPKQASESHSNEIAMDGVRFSDHISHRRAYAISADMADMMRAKFYRHVEYTRRDGVTVEFDLYSKSGTDSKVYNALLTAAARRGRWQFSAGLAELRDLSGVGSRSTVSTTIERLCEIGLVEIVTPHDCAESKAITYSLPERIDLFGQVYKPQDRDKSTPVQKAILAGLTYARRLATDPFLSGLSRTAKRADNEISGLGEKILLVLAMIDAYGALSQDEIIELTGRSKNSVKTALHRAVDLGLLVDVDKRGSTVYMTPEIDVWESIDLLTPHLRTYRLRAERKDKDLQTAQFWLERQIADWTLTPEDRQSAESRLARVRGRRRKVLAEIFPDWTDAQMWDWIDGSEIQESSLLFDRLFSILDAQERTEREFVIDEDEQDIMLNLDAYRAQAYAVAA